MRKSLTLALILLPTVALGQTNYGRIQTDRIANKQIIVITGATPDVSNGNVFKTNNGGPTTITNFLGGVDSQVITVNCGETNTTIQNNANIVTTSGADIVCTVNKAQDFAFDAAQGKWIQKSGGAAVTGCTPLGVNALQKNNAGSYAGSNETDDGTTFATAIDSRFKGANPWYDVRAFCARMISGAAPTTTATITSGTAVATLAAAGGFQNGDGVVFRGAGPTPTMAKPAAPTVTASNADTITMTGQFIANNEVPLASLQLGLYVFITTELVQPTNNEILFSEPISRPCGLQAFICNDFKPKVELISKFVLPLFRKTARADNHASFEIASDYQHADEIAFR